MANIRECFQTSGYIEAAALEPHYLYAETLIPEVNNGSETWSQPYTSDSGLSGEGYFLENGYLKNNVTNPFGYNTWSQNSGNLPNNTGAAATSGVEYNGIVYIVGGREGSYSGADYTKIYYKPKDDFVAGIGDWVGFGEYPQGALGFSTSVIIEDYLYILGGVVADKEQTDKIYKLPLAKLESLTVVSSDWIECGNIPDVTAVLSDTDVLYCNNEVYIIGGSDNSGAVYSKIYYKSKENFIAGTGEWVGIGAYPSTNTAWTRAEIADGNLYLIGGQGGGVYFDNVYSLPLSLLITKDFTSSDWSKAGALPTSNVTQCGTFLVDETIYIIGGVNIISGYPFYTSVKSQPIGAIQPLNVLNPIWDTSKKEGDAKLYVLLENTDLSSADMGSNNQLKFYTSIDNGGVFTERSTIRRTDISTEGFVNAYWYETDKFDISKQSGIISQIKTGRGTGTTNPNVKLYHACMVIFD